MCLLVEYDRRLIWVNGHRSLMLFDEFLSVAFEEWCLVEEEEEGEREEKGGEGGGGQ